MARNNIKNKKHSESAKKLNWLRENVQYVLFGIAEYKRELTAQIDSKKKGESFSEAKIVYNSQCLKRDRALYNKYMKEIRLTKKMLADASHYQE